MLARALLRRPTPLLRRRYASTTTAPPDPKHIMKPLTPPSAPQYPPGLMQRQPARARNLPTLAELNPNTRWLRTLPIFTAIIVISALGIFNYQKVNSPVITANLYSLRTNPAVRAVLGREVYFGSKWAWVHGSINLVSGKIDVWFWVGGTARKGICTFKANRYGGKSGTWKTMEWSLKLEGTQEVMDLLEGAEDPLADKAF